MISANEQSVYVPWLVCMDSSSDDLSSCDSQAGISKPASTAPAAILDSFFTADEPIRSTPTVYINGASVKTSYSAIHTALCSAEPSLSGCSSEMPLDAEKEITEFCTVPAEVEV